MVVDLAAGTATGADGSDILGSIENVTGSGHADTLTGDSGANILDGGAGADALTGGAGADTFKISLLDGNVDTIGDFSATDGDRLDLTDVVSVSQGDAISDYVRLEEDGNGNTVLQVDTSGTGEDANFEDVAILEGSVDLNVDEIVQVTQAPPDGG